MKKSQIFGLPTTYVFIVIIAILIILFGAIGIKQLNSSGRGAQLTNFVLSLRNKLMVNRVNVNVVSQEMFALPEDIGSVCFVDTNTDFAPFVNKKLTEKIHAFSNHNLFIEPLNRQSPYKLPYLHITEFENPLCIKVVNGKLKLTLEGYGNVTRISAPDESKKQKECVSILYNKKPEDSLDIVFLGYGYGNIRAFSSDVNRYANSVLFEIEPFKANKEKINIYRIDDFSLNCEVGSFIWCDSKQANILAANCPHDQIIILAERGLFTDAVNPVRSSAIGNLAKINTADEKFVLMHELGHTIGGLADEYVDDYYKLIDFDVEKYPNCDKGPNPCNDWVTVTRGCYEGCTLQEFFRPTESSIMSRLDVHEFGPVNEKVILDVFDHYGEDNE